MRVGLMGAAYQLAWFFSTGGRIPPGQAAPSDNEIAYQLFLTGPLAIVAVMAVAKWKKPIRSAG